MWIIKSHYIYIIYIIYTQVGTIGSVLSGDHDQHFIRLHWSLINIDGENVWVISLPCVDLFSCLIIRSFYSVVLICRASVSSFEFRIIDSKLQRVLTCTNVYIFIILSVNWALTKYRVLAVQLSHVGMLGHIETSAHAAALMRDIVSHTPVLDYG